MAARTMIETDKATKSSIDEKPHLVFNLTNIRLIGSAYAAALHLGLICRNLTGACRLI